MQTKARSEYLLTQAPPAHSSCSCNSASSSAPQPEAAAHVGCPASSGPQPSRQVPSQVVRYPAEMSIVHAACLQGHLATCASAHLDLLWLALRVSPMRLELPPMLRLLSMLCLPSTLRLLSSMLRLLSRLPLSSMLCLETGSAPPSASALPPLACKHSKLRSHAYACHAEMRCTTHRYAACLGAGRTPVLHEQLMKGPKC